MKKLLGQVAAAVAVAAVLVMTGCESDDDPSSTPSTAAGKHAGGAAGSHAGMGWSAGTGGTAGLEAGGASAAGAKATQDIVDTAVSAGQFKKLAAALEAASLTQALKATGPFTVFAPTDAAFDAFEAQNPGVLAGLSKEQLTAVLTYHVVKGKVESKDLVSGSLVETLNGARAAVDLTSGPKIAGAAVTTADVSASNGVIHVIDRVMLPPSKNVVETAVAAGNFTKLAAALVSTGLDATLKGSGPFTVFAPTDEAFAAFEAKNPGVLSSLTTAQLSDILLYHVASGWAGPADLKNGATVPTALAGKALKVDIASGVKINDANVTSTNIVSTNGVIHVIDAILVPPSS